MNLDKSQKKMSSSNLLYLIRIAIIMLFMGYYIMNFIDRKNNWETSNYLWFSILQQLLFDVGIFCLLLFYVVKKRQTDMLYVSGSKILRKVEDVAIILTIPFFLLEILRTTWIQPGSGGGEFCIGLSGYIFCYIIYRIEFCHSKNSKILSGKNIAIFIALGALFLFFTLGYVITWLFTLGILYK